MANRISSSDYYIVGSMPLEICKLSRSSRSSIYKEEYETAPNKGYCASQSTHHYGYKLHAVCSIEGVFTDFDLTQASIHDTHYLKDIKSLYGNCIFLGGEGCLCTDYQVNMSFFESDIAQDPNAQKQKNYKPQAYIFRESRKRTETLFSQLCDQFMIRRIYAKFFDGFKNRILSKIIALTVIQLINKLDNKNINNLKGHIA